MTLIKINVIANDRLELNLGLRYLRSKGYQVASYYISNCPCRKGVIKNGI